MSLAETKRGLKSLDPQSILLFVRFLEENIENWKEEIINCPKDEFLSLQGAIRRVRVLITDLKRPTIEIKKVSNYTE